MFPKRVSRQKLIGILATLLVHFKRFMAGFWNAS